MSTATTPLPSTAQLAARAAGLLASMGASTGGDQAARTPITGGSLGPAGAPTDPTGVGEVAGRAAAAFAAWHDVPAPARGQLVRRLGELLREFRSELGELVSIEAGKIRSEGLGEVQEMIDICEFAVGLSRQLHGLTIASERPGHRLQETWHPIGPVAVISAFNFPVAVWSWNAALAFVCGNPVVWKPSDKAPLTAVAVSALFRRAADECEAPADLHQLVLGGADTGAALMAHPAFPVVSATGSTAMGARVGPVVAARFGRSILELGGNNAAIVAPTADLELALRGIVFSAAGTAGQRCTTLRRLIVHRSIHDQLVERLAGVYARLPIGDPLASGTLVGPLIDAGAHTGMRAALDAAAGEGGEVIGGDRVLAEAAPDAFYAAPALATMPAHSGPGGVMHAETFAPILYAVAYDDLDQAIAMHNSVPQGLASSIFTNDLREAERFLAASDCGIANVNIGTSGAEIGGAFGGEKQTGGGRESGSDAWKGYMRRATNTINYSTALPLAQGIDFDIEA